MNPLISILLPVRNAAASLPMALDSLCAQSLGAFEILAVDDGSDDGGATRAVLAAYAGKDRRIQPVAGHGAAEQVEAFLIPVDLCLVRDIFWQHKTFRVCHLP